MANGPNIFQMLFVIKFVIRKFYIIRLECFLQGRSLSDILSS